MNFSKLFWNLFVVGFQDFFTFYKGGGGGGTSTTNQSIDPAILPYITYGLEEANYLITIIQ